MKQALLISFFAFCLFNFANAQNASIKGLVVEKQNRWRVEFASISLLKKTDSTVVAGVLTESNGRFAINHLAIGEYLLKIISIGYDANISSVSISSNNQKISLDTIELKLLGKVLDEVTVTGQKKTVANKLDKQTYKANQFESAKGGSSIDVLKNLPSIAVNSSGEISVRGSTGFLVLINGKPIITDAQVVLSQIPANSIENIELITAPSAKYDADGKAGIINITTKKGTTDGLAFQANVLAGLPGTTAYQNIEKPIRMGADFTLSFKKEKWDVSFGANYARNDVNGRREGDVFTKNFIKNTITRFPSVGERSFDKYNYGARFSVSYAATKNDVLAVGFFASKKYQQRRADIVYNNSTANLTTGAIVSSLTYFNSNLQNKEGEFVLGNFDYSHTFKNESKISTSAIYESAYLYGNTLNQNLNYPAKSANFQEVQNPYTNPINGYRLKTDYSAAIGKAKLEIGYQFRYDRQKGEFDYFITPVASQPDIGRFRGSAQSVNKINAIYTQVSNTISRLQYIAGLRYEYATREVILSYANTPYQLYLSNLFPSLNLLYTFNSNWNLKAGYSKRVQRNNNFELNPIPEREHSETLEQGDPNLLPQFIDLVEMGITHSYEKGSLFASLYFQNIKNPIQRVNSVYADTILNRVFTNAGRARLIGLEVGSNWKPQKWLTTYIGVNIYNYKITGDLNVLGSRSTVNNANWVYSMNTNTSFDLGKSWNLQAGFNYLSTKATAQGEDSRFLSPNTSVKKTLMNGRFTVGLQWQNMNLGFMNANQQRITTFGPDFYTTTNYIYETDVLLLNFSFNLNKLNSKAKLPTSEIGEKEF